MGTEKIMPCERSLNHSSYSTIVALLSTTVDLSIIVLLALVVLSITQSFQCIDTVTGESLECRLCQTHDPMTGDLYHCDGQAQSFQQSLKGFSTPVVWLIFAAFHLGRAVDVTKLGKRAAVLLVQLFGNSTLGLAYAIEISEVLLAPFVPSNTARGGGIVLPVVTSLTTSLGSTIDQDPELGALLSLVGSHSNLVSASLFMTGMAANPLVVTKAKLVFPGIEFNFVRWILGASVPALATLLMMPILFMWWCNADRHVGSGEQVKQLVNDQLFDLGAMAACEKVSIT
jgi:DASS family divalent anion:Na+ symporter